MNKIQIQMFPALQGDCLLISFGDRKRKHILIDAGLKDTYFDYLKRRLLEIADLNEEILLFVVTHTDEDHIEGAIELLKDNGSSDNPKIVKINEIWHNSYRHLQFPDKRTQKLNYQECEILNELIVGNCQRDQLNKIHDKNISIVQGSSLASLIYEGKYKWNSSFNEAAINCEVIRDITLDSEITLRLLSPNADKLNALASTWKQELNKKKYGFQLSDNKLFDDAFEFYMMRLKELDGINENKKTSLSDKFPKFESILTSKEEKDYSVTNGASIAFIIEYYSKRLLFLADAHSDIIYNKLADLINRENYPSCFDAIKVAHHGSRKNISRNIVNLINGKKFLISTNGIKHNHPSFDTLAKIVAKTADYQRKIIFNYTHKASEFVDNPDLKDRFNYLVDISDGSDAVNIWLEEDG